MEKAVAGCRQAPEFLPVSANPFYCIPTGNQSPYGDLMMTMLESLVECKGESAKVRAIDEEMRLLYETIWCSFSHYIPL